VHTPPPTVAVAPEVVLVVSQLPSPQKEPIADGCCDGGAAANQACGEDMIGTNPQFARRRIREKRDVLRGLLQLVECYQAAIQKPARVDRGLDTLRTAIEEAHDGGR
jgi:hypothetical protein